MENNNGQKYKVFKNLNLGELRALEEKGEHGYNQFILEDVCRMIKMDIRNAMRGIEKNGIGEYVSKTYIYRDASNRHSPFVRAMGLRAIEEPALFYLISVGRSQACQDFRVWLYGEVLPALMQHGGYIMEEDRIEYYTKPEKVKDLINNINYQKEMKDLFYAKYQKLYNTALDLEKENHKMKRDIRVTGYNVGNFVIPLKMTYDLREWAIYNPLDRLHILTTLDEIITAIDDAFKSLSGDPEKIKEADEKTEVKDKA